MIGKVQDIVSAAVVIGAADQAGSGGSSAKPDSVQGVEKSSSAKNGAVGNASATEQLMEKDDPSKQAENENQKMDEEAVSSMTNELNELMDKINCDLEFKWNKEVDLMTVTMVDKKTKEMIKQFPPEDMIKNMINAKEWIGAFLDKNA